MATIANLTLELLPTALQLQMSDFHDLLFLFLAKDLPKIDSLFLIPLEIPIMAILIADEFEDECN